MLGLVVLKIEGKNTNICTEMLENFFFKYGRDDETRDFFHSLGSEFIEVPDKFRDKLDVKNFKNSVRKPTIKEIIKMLGG